MPMIVSMHAPRAVATRSVGENDSPRPWLSTGASVVKVVPEGGYVGYGCTYRATRPTRIAVLPVGYHEGYDRGLSGAAHKGMVHAAKAMGRVAQILYSDPARLAEAKAEHAARLDLEGAERSATVPQPDGGGQGLGARQRSFGGALLLLFGYRLVRGSRGSGQGSA